MLGLSGGRPDGRHLVAKRSREGEKSGSRTTGSIRQLQEANKSAKQCRIEGRFGFWSGDTERATIGGAVRVPLHTDRHQEVGVLSPSRGMGGECGARSVGGDGRARGHVEPHQTGGAGTVESSTRGATRHCRDDLDVATVPHIQQRRRLEQVERVGIPRPQDILQASSAGGEQQVWAESEAGRLISAVMDPSGSFVVTCVPWFGLVSGESSGQSREETIHGTVLRGFGLGGSHCPLLRVRAAIQEADSHLDEHDVVGSDGQDGAWPVPRRGSVQSDGGHQARQLSSGRRQESGRKGVGSGKVSSAGRADAGAGRGSPVESGQRQTSASVSRQQGGGSRMGVSKRAHSSQQDSGRVGWVMEPPRSRVEKRSAVD